MTTVQVLTKAMKLIEKGWCKGSQIVHRDGSVSYCASWAIGQVAGRGSSCGARTVLKEVIGCPCVVAWNDAPSRRKSHVLAAYKKAIELAKARQL